MNEQDILEELSAVFRDVPESKGRTVTYGNFWGHVLRRLGIGASGRPDITIGGGSPMIVRVSESGLPHAKS